MSHAAILDGRRFAALLGWHGLDETQFKLTPHDCGTLPVGTLVTCWSTSHLNFFIQINQLQTGKFGEYNVSVVADRYDIAYVPFEPCRFESDDEAQAEAQRLAASVRSN